MVLIKAISDLQPGEGGMEIMETDRTSAWTEFMFEARRVPALRQRFRFDVERLMEGDGLCAQGRIAA